MLSVFSAVFDRAQNAGHAPAAPGAANWANQSFPVPVSWTTRGMSRLMLENEEAALLTLSR
jgi:hypothetical protein